MNASGHKIGKRGVDQSLAIDAASAGKRLGLDLDGEMALTAAVVTRVPMMAGTVVDDGEPCGSKGGAEPRLDDFGHGQGGLGGHVGLYRVFREPDDQMPARPQRDRPGTRFHGRVEGRPEACAHPGCEAAGEFRAPGSRRPGFDGPGDWRWLCLDHVRAFNAGYNFFAGMTPEEIADAQRPTASWERETRAFSAGGADRPPPWADFADPLDAIGARFRARMERERERKDGKPLSERDRDNLKLLELDIDADRSMLRKRYSELVRRYHPDRNGGDRSQEALLQKVIAAYQDLRGAPAFA